MGRKIILSIWLTMLVVTAVTYAQQELYIEQLKSVDAFKMPIVQGAISVRTNLLAVVLQNKSLKMCDPILLTEKIVPPNVPALTNAVTISRSGKTFAIGTPNGQVYILNLVDGGLAKVYSVHSEGINALALQYENWLFTAGGDKLVKITDAEKGDVLGTLPKFDSDVTALAMHPGEKNFAIGLSTGQVCIYSIGNLTMLNTLTDGKNRISSLCYSPNGKYLAAGIINGNVIVWDVQSGTAKIKYVQKGTISSVIFDPKSRWVISMASDSTVKFYDLATLANVKTLTEPDGYTTYAAFLNDDTFLTGTSKGQLKHWKVALSVPDTINPGFVLDQPIVGRSAVRVFSQQYEIKGLAYDDTELKEATLNGRTIALMPISAGDAAKVPAGMKAVKRFNAVLNLDSTGLIPFEIKVADKANHTVSQKGVIKRISNEEAVEVQNPLVNSETELISIPVQFQTWFEVASYSISVNMVDIVSGQIPEFKVAGDTISETVPLMAGYNQIQLSITSKSGENFTKTIGVNRKASILGDIPSAGSFAKKERGASSGPQKWAVVVGVSEYMNPGIPSLNYADKDAEAFSNFLRRPEGGGYDSDHLHVLLNKDATLANVKEALINFLNQAIDIDLVVIYFAGHGAPQPARPQNMYLLTYDSDPNSLGTSAFPMWDIQTVLARYISAKRVVVFSDACHSGGISVNFATRGLGTTEQNLVNQYLTDLSKTKEGIVVFTASAAGEVSQEFPEFGHGVFTYYMMEGLKGKADYNNDYTVTINELMQYVEEQVKRKTHGAQNPTRSQTEYDKELTISIVPH